MDGRGDLGPRARVPDAVRGVAARPLSSLTAGLDRRHVTRRRRSSPEAFGGARTSRATVPPHHLQAAERAALPDRRSSLRRRRLWSRPRGRKSGSFHRQAPRRHGDYISAKSQGRAARVLRGRPERTPAESLVCDAGTEPSPGAREGRSARVSNPQQPAVWSQIRGRR